MNELICSVKLIYFQKYTNTILIDLNLRLDQGLEEDQHIFFVQFEPFRKSEIRRESAGAGVGKYKYSSKFDDEVLSVHCIVSP